QAPRPGPVWRRAGWPDLARDPGRAGQRPALRRHPPLRLLARLLPAAGFAAEIPPAGRRGTAPGQAPGDRWQPRRDPLAECRRPPAALGRRTTAGISGGALPAGGPQPIAPPAPPPWAAQPVRQRWPGARQRTPGALAALAVGGGLARRHAAVGPSRQRLRRPRPVRRPRPAGALFRLGRGAVAGSGRLWPVADLDRNPESSLCHYRQPPAKLRAPSSGRSDARSAPLLPASHGAGLWFPVGLHPAAGPAARHALCRPAALRPGPPAAAALVAAEPGRQRGPGRAPAARLPTLAAGAAAPAQCRCARLWPAPVLGQAAGWLDAAGLVARPAAHVQSPTAACLAGGGVDAAGGALAGPRPRPGRLATEVAAGVAAMAGGQSGRDGFGRGAAVPRLA